MVSAFTVIPLDEGVKKTLIPFPSDKNLSKRKKSRVLPKPLIQPKGLFKNFHQYPQRNSGTSPPKILITHSSIPPPQRTALEMPLKGPEKRRQPLCLSPRPFD